MSPPWQVASDRPCHDAGAALVLQPVALTGDLHDGRVVQYAVEHGGGEHGVTSERLIPAAEGQVSLQATNTIFQAFVALFLLTLGFAYKVIVKRLSLRMADALFDKMKGWQKL